MQNKPMIDHETSSYNIPKFLNQTEAAKILCKHPRWLERKRWEGGGPTFHYIGRTPVYDLKDLLSSIDKQPTMNNTICN